ncbi:hypothetical protein SPONN_1692 [uncultured Candidatus Thioglobus sp.]|nr:hypothetical protein SPONN_1692 [uncultured Candidatus Thioglobus sp.]
MEFKAVEFMRQTRNRIYEETKDFSYKEQKEYLEQHSRWFTPNKTFQPTETVKGG